MGSMLSRAMELLIGSDTVALPSLSSNPVSPPKRPLKKMTERELIQLESEIGAEVFGPVPEGRHRQFFNLDPTTWIWYEDWQENGKMVSSTTRYELKGDEMLKVHDDGKYSYVVGDELNNLSLAINVYYEKVMRTVYGRDPRTGEKLPDIINR